MPETRSRIATWHVAHQEQMIADQCKSISRIRVGGLPTEDVETFLKQKYDVLAFRQQRHGSDQPSRSRMAHSGGCPPDQRIEIH